MALFVSQQRQRQQDGRLAAGFVNAGTFDIANPFALTAAGQKGMGLLPPRHGDDRCHRLAEKLVAARPRKRRCRRSEKQV